MDDKKEKFLEALARGYGIIATACEAVNVGRTTYYRWYNSDPEFKERVDEITETQVDFVESKLMQSINANDTTAIIFYLKTKGKKRGYSDKVQPAPAKTTPQEAALPSPADEKPGKRLTAKVKQKKAYIVKLLKEQGKYTKELTYQVEITAQLLVRAEELSDEIMAEGHRAVNVEYSREGNERVTVNPKEKLYLSVLEQGQRALRALGMNTESKERKTDRDSVFDFTEQLQMEKDE